MKHEIQALFFSDPELNFARFLNALESPDQALDSLIYAHASLGRLVALAGELSLISPVVPEIPHLTEHEIKDLKIISK